MRKVLKMICPTGRAKYFSQQDWTVESALIGQRKFDFWRNGILSRDRHCERSEAIQTDCDRELDCFVAVAPRNDITPALRIAPLRGY